ncbi:hypothetical protein GOA63_15165 [Sinorhizobium meliloti]|uniref:hypothetical protein n=1 Tax=Rhizobium meliloti TaxID=382 RepID=UPI001297790B|nr:hypothetical protein [Sinorhizobium meliloti]MDW9593547.1 hypothetical protein [Sinorhizobium meliloti]MDX0191705.1 hypothetical protein [Sinorhizobium meliloti]MQV09069.1 hypothetical protein [Sinorhizobium meliloti]
MIFVSKPAIDKDEWRTIVKEGEGLSAMHLRSFDAEEKVEINEDLYKKFMRYLMDLFGGKCAYCETRISSNQPGDVEHFRPKGRVVGDDFKPVLASHPQRGKINHPGYFWLAYAWSNLLPSCIDCNRYRKHGLEQPQGAGKADRFPVEGQHACVPAQLDQEVPLLIDPSKVNPALHIEFHADGTVSGKTEQGRRTIDLFGLNLREGLKEARREAYADAETFTVAHWNHVVTLHASKLAQDASRLQQIKSGRRPYAAMERMALREVNARIEAERKRTMDDLAEV